jgi:transposase InsO family protein
MFGCPLTIILDQGVHFINNAIAYFIEHFLLWHTSSTMHYPHDNGYVESTNKVINTLLTKLVNDQ